MTKETILSTQVGRRLTAFILSLVMVASLVMVPSGTAKAGYAEIETVYLTGINAPAPGNEGVTFADSVKDNIGITFQNASADEVNGVEGSISNIQWYKDSVEESNKIDSTKEVDYNTVYVCRFVVSIKTNGYVFGDDAVGTIDNTKWSVKSVVIDSEKTTMQYTITFPKTGKNDIEGINHPVQSSVNNEKTLAAIVASLPSTVEIHATGSGQESASVTWSKTPIIYREAQDEEEPETVKGLSDEVKVVKDSITDPTKVEYKTWLYFQGTFELPDNVTNAKNMSLETYCIVLHDAKKYTVTFYNDKGTTGSSEVKYVDSGSTILDYPTFTSEGYTFKDKWETRTTNEDGSVTKEEWDTGTKITSDTNLYAVWEKNREVC